MYFSFNSKIADKYGVNEAIFIQNVYFWIKQNKANDRNYYEGKYWTYNTADALAELFPFWSVHQIKRLIKKLEALEILILGNFNKKGFDRTNWYALSDEIMSIYEENETAQSIVRNRSMDSAKSLNASSEIAPPIPDINTDILPDNKKGTYVPKKELEQQPTQQEPKIKYAEFVSMTNDEYLSLVAKLGKSGTNRCVEILDNYKGANGKKYKSDYRAILNWVIGRYKEESKASKKQAKSKNQINTSNSSYDLSELDEIIRKGVI